MPEPRRDLNRPRNLQSGLTVLADQIIDFISRRRDAVRERWHRSLPFADYLVDRWEKARWLGFGEGTSVYDSVLIFGPVRVGRNTWIGPFTVLDGSGGLEIGDHCSISVGVQIYTHDSIEWSLSGGEKPIVRSPTKIGSRCYLGPNVVVARGITIGDGCVIGANSVVLDDIPAGSKAFGSPCRVVGRTDDRSSRERQEPGPPEARVS